MLDTTQIPQVKLTSDLPSTWDAETYHIVGKPQFQKAAYLLRHHEFSENSVVWDLGMGDASVALSLIAPRIPHGAIIGIDADVGMLKQAHLNHSATPDAPLRILAGNICDMDEVREKIRLSRPPSPPSVIFSNSVLNYCMKDLEAHSRFLSSAYESLDSQGVILLSFTGATNFSKLEEGRAIARQDPRFAEYFQEYKDPGRVDPSPEQYKDLLIRTGFMPLQVYLCDDAYKGEHSSAPRQIFASLDEAATWFMNSVKSHMKFMDLGGASIEEKFEFARLTITSFLDLHPDFNGPNNTVELDNTSLIVYAKKI